MNQIARIIYYAHIVQVLVDYSQLQLTNGTIRAQNRTKNAWTLQLIFVDYKRIMLSLPANAYHDIAGNNGVNSAVVRIDLSSATKSIQYLSQGVATLGITTSVASVATTLLTNAMTGIVGATRGSIISRSNLLRAGYHFQVLSMSANLAVPQVPSKLVNIHYIITCLTE